MSRLSRLLVLFLLSFSFPILILGQVSPEPDKGNSTATTIGSAKQPASRQEEWKLTRGATEWGFQVGYSPTQPTFFSGKKEYDTDGRRFAIGSISFGRVIGTVRGVTYEYLFEATPFTVAIKNEVRNPDPHTYRSYGKTMRTNTYGFAIQPAGFRYIFMPNKRLKPYAQTAVGFIFTQKPVPVPESPTYNFVGDFGGGLMYSITRQQVLKAGYRYYHISNMNIGAMNPGYNANMFYFDLTIFSK